MNDTEQSVLTLLRKLSAQDQQTLLRFAAFLANDAGNPDAPLPAADTTAPEPLIPQPQVIERPENERVADALKRLSASYPMLDKKNLLGKASELVAQHVMFGKPANVVIDEIELIFEQAYEKFVSEAGKR